MAEQNTVTKARKLPLNKKNLGWHLSEAQEELAKLLHKLLTGSLNEDALQIGLRHTYHHLNFAWNTRRLPSKHRVSQREFEEWGRYPNDIDED